MTAYEMRISDWSSDVCSSDLKTKNPRRARVSGRLWLDLLLVACPVARPRIARTIIRTAIIAVEGVAGGGTEAGHGWKLADGPDSRQDPCAPPTHDGNCTGISPDPPQFLTDPHTGPRTQEGATTNPPPRQPHPHPPPPYPEQEDARITRNSSPIARLAPCHTKEQRP